VKGLAEILGKPIAVVSVLEALALGGNKEGKVATALDAYLRASAREGAAGQTATRALWKQAARREASPWVR